VRARTHLVVVSMLGSLACLVPVLYVHDLNLIALFLSGVLPPQPAPA